MSMHESARALGCDLYGDILHVVSMLCLDFSCRKAQRLIEVDDGFVDRYSVRAICCRGSCAALGAAGYDPVARASAKAAVATCSVKASDVIQHARVAVPDVHVRWAVRATGRRSE